MVQDAKQGTLWHCVWRRVVMALHFRPLVHSIDSMLGEYQRGTTGPLTAVGIITEVVGPVARGPGQALVVAELVV